MSAESPIWEADKASYAICGFTLDVARWELRDERRRRVELAPLPFRLLLFLIEQRARVVSKEELFEAMWGDAVVNEGSLTQAISIVRRAFGGGDVGQQIIQNVRGRGYRCAAPVERTAGPLETEPPAAQREAPSSILRLKASPEVASGREAELARLMPSATSALAGRGSALLIAGSVGIGKTWLAAEAVRRMSEHNAFVCELRGYEDQGAPPLWPLRTLAVALLRRHTGPDRALSLEHASELRMLGPEVAALLPQSPHTPLRTPAEQRFFLFSALVELLARASSQEPLVVLLEDLHWMDEATLLFLERLAPELSRMAVLLLCTYRHASSAALERVIQTFRRDAQTLNLVLSGLDASATGALLRAHGVAAPSPALLDRALTLTQGNPLFLTQLARFISEQAPHAQDDPALLVLPEESRAALRGQLALLSEGSQRCLELAALLGDDFHLGELQQATGCSHEALLRELAPAYTLRLLKRDSEPTWRRRFEHPSVRSAIYESISEPRRRQLHLQIADALARMARPRLSAVAHHYYESAPLGDVDKALHYGLSAARAACAATAYEDAIAHCRRMLAILEVSGNARTRYEVELLLGRALRFVLAEPELIYAAYIGAAASAEQLGDGELHAEAAMSFAGRAPWGITLLRAVGVVEPRELALLQTSLSLLPDVDSPSRARVLGWLAFALYNSDQNERRAALAQQSVAMARKCGDQAALVECLMLAQLTLRSPDLLPTRIESLREAAELAYAASLRSFQIDATEELSWALFESGDAPGAELAMQRVMRIAEELGRPQDRRKEARFRTMQLDAAGKFSESEALLEAVRLQTSWPPEHPENTAIRTMLIQRMRGKSQRSIAELEALAQRFPLPVAWHCGLVSAYVSVGRMDDARREITRLRANEFAAIPDDHNRVSSYVNLAIAGCALGERAVCALLREKLEPYLGRNVLVGMRGFYYGPVSRTLGMLDLALGDYAQALERLTSAVARDQELAAAVSEAWSRLLHAEADFMQNGLAGGERVRRQVDAAEQLIAGMELAPLDARVAHMRALLRAGQSG